MKKKEYFKDMQKLSNSLRNIFFAFVNFENFPAY